ncbi:MAG: N4-gp56 family major capsid protein [Planctomycetota bacterium]
MADAILGGSSTGTGVTQLSNQILTAYQQTAFFALREGVVFDQFASVKPGNVTSPGTPVSFLLWSDMTVASTALNEGIDVAARTLSDSTITVTPAEYGDAVILTLRLRADDFLIGFDANVANLLNYGMVNTIDFLAEAAISGGTNVRYGGLSESHTAAANIDATGILAVTRVREARAQLRGASALPWDGSNYGAIIHPDVAFDLKEESGDAGWATTATHSAADRVWNDEIGKFANCRFIETPRALLTADGATATVDAYTTYFFGQQFLAKAETIPPHMVMGPVTDKLKRFQPLGWHFYAGWDTFREAALRRVVSSSSIGAN